MPTESTNLKHIRILLGYTQGAFAAELGVPQSTLSSVERQQRNLSPRLLSTAQFVTKTPREFFEEPIDYYESLDLRFRTARLGRAEAEKIATAFSITEHYLKLRYPDQTSDLPDLELPHGPLDQVAIEDAAARTREHLSLSPDTAIGNLAAALHQRSVIVTSLPDHIVEDTNFDGVSTPTPAPLRVIALNRQRSGDRYRFSLAHELGHLVLHAATTRRDITALETEANQFAGALLMPRGLLCGTVTPETTLGEYTNLKAQWGCSIQAIVRRAHELDLIDYKRHRSLRMQISGRGWRVEEPGDVLLENTFVEPVDLTHLVPCAPETAVQPRIASVTQLPTTRSK